jgi:uncharacterized protein
MRHAALLSIGAALACAFLPLAHAFELPLNDGYVTDAAGVLAPSEDQQLEDMLTQYRNETSNEIAIVIVQSLSGSAIEDVGLAIARAWKVGSTKDNGILILASYQDRAVRIDVGYGLEGAVPDLVAKGIIDTDIVPAFRDARYAEGMLRAVDSLKRHIGGEYTADRYNTETNMSAIAFAAYLFFLVFEWIVAILARSKSWWLGGIFGSIGGVIIFAIAGWWFTIPILAGVGLLLDFLVSKAYAKHGRRSPWWAGGSWGPGSGGRFGGGGGGFGGFGGGGFGGGGASGKW